jgi:hypothetical protein
MAIILDGTKLAKTIKDRVRKILSVLPKGTNFSQVLLRNFDHGVIISLDSLKTITFGLKPFSSSSVR